MPARTVTLNILGDTSKAQKAVRSIAEETESTSKRMGTAFSGVFENVNRTGVLGPLGESIAGVGRMFDGASLKAKDFGKTLMGISGAGVGISAGLIALGGEDLQAMAGAKASITATGNSVAEFGEKFEQAAKHGQDFGFKTADSVRSLSVLAEGLGDPQKALNAYATVLDMARFRHVALVDAAHDAVIGLNGSTRVFRAYGVPVKDLTQETKALADAQEHLQLSDAEMASKRTITIADTLRHAQAVKKVQDAQKELAAEQVKQADGRTFPTVEDAFAAVGQKTAGQADAWVASFSGQLGVLETKAHDAAAALGADWGAGLLALNAGIGIVGSGFEIGAAAMGKWGRAARTAATLQEALSGAQEKASIARMRLSTAEIQLTLAEGAGEKAAAAEAVAQAKLNSAQAQGAVAAAKLAVAQGRVTKADSEGSIAAAELATAQSAAAVRAAGVKEAKLTEGVAASRAAAAKEAEAANVAATAEIASADRSAAARVLVAEKAAARTTTIATEATARVVEAERTAAGFVGEAWAEAAASEARSAQIGAEAAARADQAKVASARIAAAEAAAAWRAAQLEISAPLLVPGAGGAAAAGGALKKDAEVAAGGGFLRTLGGAGTKLGKFAKGGLATAGAIALFNTVMDTVNSHDIGTEPAAPTVTPEERNIPYPGSTPEMLPQFPAFATAPADRLSAMADAQAAAIMPAAPAMGAAVSSQAAGGDGGTVTIQVPVNLDGRQIAYATASHVRDELLNQGRSLNGLGMA